MPGDLVMTRDDGAHPLRWIGRRTIAAAGDFAPIHIAANTFGQHRKLALSPLHRVLIRDSLAELLFGEREVLVAARDLANGTSAHYGSGPDLVTYHGLLLPNHQAVLAAGCPVESLYIGRLRRDSAALAASVLGAEDAARLPEHARPIWPVLKPFEARTLAMLRAA